jgi:hypothetical protein
MEKKKAKIIYEDADWLQLMEFIGGNFCTR